MKNKYIIGVIMAILVPLIAIGVGASDMWQEGEIPPFDPNLKPIQMSQEEFDELKANYTPQPTTEPITIYASGLETRGIEIELPTGDKLQLPSNFYVSDYIMFIECIGPCPIPPITVLAQVGREELTLGIDRNGDFWDSIPAADGRRPDMDQLFQWILDKYPDKRRFGYDSVEIRRK
ncbi:MAG: hypothetical protein R2911_32205 [Caldilineaceae bacterium]